MHFVNTGISVNVYCDTLNLELLTTQVSRRLLKGQFIVQFPTLDSPPAVIAEQISLRESVDPDHS